MTTAMTMNTTADFAEHLLGILRDGEPVGSGERAEAMIAAAIAFLYERFGEDHTLDKLASFAQTVKYRGILERCQPSPAGLH